MADLIFNVAKGRGIQLCKNVEDNSPVAAVLRIFAIVSTDTDDALKDADTMAAVFALANTAEAAAGVNLTDDGTDLTITLDDSGNLHDAILSDQTWTAVAAAAAWTDIIVAYDADGSDTDATTIPLSLHDFAVTPNGGDIVADFPVTGFFRAS